LFKIFSPRSPPKIKTVRIVDNPFPDIIPRITAEEKRVQQRAREAAQREREQEMRLRGAKKWVLPLFAGSTTHAAGPRDVKLLSFGDDEEEAEPVVTKKKTMVRPDRAWFMLGCQAMHQPSASGTG
jgi:peptidyl-prolyl cis-trans isomerase SDCCAG10